METACQLVERLQGKDVGVARVRRATGFPSGVTATPRGSSPIGTVATTMLLALSITETALSTSFAMRSKEHARVEHVVWSDHRCPPGDAKTSNRANSGRLLAPRGREKPRRYGAMPGTLLGGRCRPSGDLATKNNQSRYHEDNY